MTLRDSQGRFVLALLVTGIALIVLSLVNIAGFVLRSDTPAVFAPLGPYPTQQIVDVTDTAVIVDATRCASIPQVRVMSMVSWHRLEPPGAEFGAGFGITDLTFGADGCNTTRFIYTIPAAVRALDHPGDQWTIVRIDTPIDTQDRFGEQIAWQSTPFVITPLTSS